MPGPGLGGPGGQGHLASPCALASSKHGSSMTQTSVMVALSGCVPAVKEKLHGLLWSNHGIKQCQVPQNVLVSASSPKDSREGKSASTSFFFFLTVLGLPCCLQAFSSCGARVSHFGVFLVAEHGQAGSAVAPQHVESTQTRDWTRVPCLWRQILNHWTTRLSPAFTSW